MNKPPKQLHEQLMNIALATLSLQHENQYLLDKISEMEKMLSLTEAILVNMGVKEHVKENPYESKSVLLYRIRRYLNAQATTTN
jgi:hypothetical protein